MTSLPLHDDHARATSFGNDARRYDRARPSYPEALIDWLCEPTVHDVVDIGCGTGIAARLFIARGMHVLGIEPDARMAAVARSHGIDVVVTPFESFDPAGRAFDLAISAQAWHWVVPSDGANIVTHLLRPGGRVALFWNVIHHDREVRAALDKIYRSIAPGLLESSVFLGDALEKRLVSATTAIDATGQFAPCERRSYSWDLVYSQAAWLEHLTTHSDHTRLDPKARAKVLDAVGTLLASRGGSLTAHYETAVVSARRAR